MMKSNRFWVIMFAMIIIVCLGAVLLLGRKQGNSARIYLNGRPVETVDLTAQRDTYVITVETGDGGYNNIEVRQGRIRVAEANCASGVCVNRGWVSAASTPIVCLPHGLVIEIDNVSDIDGVVG